MIQSHKRPQLNLQENLKQKWSSDLSMLIRDRRAGVYTLVSMKGCREWLLLLSQKVHFLVLHMKYYVFCLLMHSSFQINNLLRYYIKDRHFPYCLTFRRITRKHSSLSRSLLHNLVRTFLLLGGLHLSFIHKIIAADKILIIFFTL